MPSTSARLKILMTEGTSLSARQTLYTLGGRYTIDVLDPSSLCQCRFSLFVRRWHQSPNFAHEPQAFLEFLAERIKAERYDVLLPTHEQVYLLSRFRDELTPHIGLALPEFTALRRMQDKAQFTRLLAELGLPYPPTAFVRTRQELIQGRTFPCYVKLAHGTAGCGVFHVRDARELAAVADRLAAAGLLEGDVESLVQQPARGVQSTVQAVFQDGRLVGAHCFEARDIGVGGMSTARISASHPVVLAHVERLGGYLRWHGAMFLDYFFDASTGQPEYIEANPRIGETVNALLCGVNLGELLVRVSRGESLDTSSPVLTTQLGVRTQSFFMILLSRAMEGANRRQLWGQIWKRWRRQGLYADSQDELTRLRKDLGSFLPAFWIHLQLLVNPRLSHGIVAKSTANYALPASATEVIDNLPEGAFERHFGERHAVRPT
jgi:predicted ATP-grasp superfamily ATP-dependent carboligase